MKKKKQVKKSIYRELFPVIGVIVLCFLIVILATTYAFFTYYRTQRSDNVVYTANFNILLDDNGQEGIRQVGAFPVYDEVGRKSEPYAFTLKNLGTVAANYKMRLVADEKAIQEDGCADNLLSDTSIKIQLIKDGTVVKEDLISNLQDYEIDSGYIGLEEGVNKSYQYELRLWLNSATGAEAMGRHYHGRIDVVLSDPTKASE